MISPDQQHSWLRSFTITLFCWRVITDQWKMDIQTTCRNSDVKFWGSSSTASLCADLRFSFLRPWSSTTSVVDPYEILLNIALTSQTLDLAVVQQHLTCHVAFVSIITNTKVSCCKGCLAPLPSKVQRLWFYILELLDPTVEEKIPPSIQMQNHFQKLLVSVALWEKQVES